MSRILFPLLLAGCLPLFAPARAHGQAAAGPSRATVSAVGTETVKQRPAEFRMTIQLSEKAPTLKEALDKLKARQEAAVLQLQQFGAQEDAITPEEPAVSAGGANATRQMQRLMMMQRARGGRVPKGLQTPKSVTVTANLTASWPLEGKQPEAVLQFCHDLQTKITDADLAGLKEQKPLSPEEEELAAEMEQMGYYGEEEAKPGEPSFFYIGRISDEQRQQAMQAAFAKAKQQAARLAAAAGADLGKLASLSSHAMQAGDGDPYSARMIYQIMQQAGSSGDGEEDEAVSQSPGEINFKVVVQASFELQ